MYDYYPEDPFKNQESEATRILHKNFSRWLMERILDRLVIKGPLLTREYVLQHADLVTGLFFHHPHYPIIDSAREFALELVADAGYVDTKSIGCKRLEGYALLDERSRIVLMSYADLNGAQHQAVYNALRLADGGVQGVGVGSSFAYLFDDCETVDKATDILQDAKVPYSKGIKSKKRINLLA
jgi:hypothetical protein